MNDTEIVSRLELDHLDGGEAVAASAIVGTTRGQDSLCLVHITVGSRPDPLQMHKSLSQWDSGNIINKEEGLLISGRARGLG